MIHTTQHNVSTRNPRVLPKQHCQSCKSSTVEPNNNSQPERRVYINSCSDVNLNVPAAVQFMNQKNARNDQDNDVRCFPPNEEEIRNLLLTTKQNKATQQNQVNNCFFVVHVVKSKLNFDPADINKNTSKLRLNLFYPMKNRINFIPYREKNVGSK